LAIHTGLRQGELLELKRSGPGYEVVAAHGRAYPRGEHEAVILPESVVL
jgi:hypothetical protein